MLNNDNSPLPLTIAPMGCSASTWRFSGLCHDTSSTADVRKINKIRTFAISVYIQQICEIPSDDRSMTRRHVDTQTRRVTRRSRFDEWKSNFLSTIVFIDRPDVICRFCKARKCDVFAASAGKKKRVREKVLQRRPIPPDWLFSQFFVKVHGASAGRRASERFDVTHADTV